MTGVLALQGDFIEHIRAVREFGEDTVEVRDRADMERMEIDRMILPGGESSVQTRLLRATDLLEPVRDFVREGRPVLGTCAGLILLAETVDGRQGDGIGLLPVSVKRNAFGRQIASFHHEGEFRGLGEVPMEFIRAPYIESVSEGVEVKSTFEDKITAVEYKNILGLAYHPELEPRSKIIEYFLRK